MRYLLTYILFLWLFSNNKITLEICPSPCKTCITPTTNCLTCISGHLLKDRDCSTLCTSPCSDCEITATQCTGCISGQNLVLLTHSCELICALPCKSCQGSATYCTDCQLGYQLTAHTCRLICTSPCATCSVTATNCNSCISQYQLIVHDCQPICQSPCATCTITPTNCVTCITNYRLSGGVCLLNCNSPCSTCINTPDTCTSCKPDYQLNGTICKLICDSNCKTCENTPTHCKTCYSGQDLSQILWICVISCVDPCATCINSPSNCVTCINGQTKNVITGNCDLDCNPSCKTCANNPTFCTSCQAFFQLYESSCKLICNVGCLNCEVAPNNCSACVDPWVLNINTCVFSCQTPCVTCNGSLCTSCIAGFQVNNDTGTCDRICNSTCKTCVGSPNTCTSCINGQGLKDLQCWKPCPDKLFNNLGFCIPCAPTCQNCSLTADHCTSCYGGFLLYKGNCIVFCPLGTQETPSSCVDCHPSCTTCRGSATNCLTCAEPYAQQENTCVMECPSKYFKSSLLCLPCLPSCENCTESAGDCSSCEAGKGLLGKICYDVSPQGQQIEQTSNIIKPCDSSCGSCFDGPLSCSSCENNLTLFNKTCISGCPTGLQLNKDCLLCDPGCKTCSLLQSNCTSCESNFGLLNNICVDICPPGLFKNGTICSNYNCPSDCLTCFGPFTNNCLTCKEGKILNGNECVNICPPSNWNGSACNLCNKNSLGNFAFNNTCVSQCPFPLIADSNEFLCKSPLECTQISDQTGCTDCEVGQMIMINKSNSRQFCGLISPINWNLLQTDQPTSYLIKFSDNKINQLNYLQPFSLINISITNLKFSIDFNYTIEITTNSSLTVWNVKLKFRNEILINNSFNISIESNVSGLVPSNQFFIPNRLTTSMIIYQQCENGYSQDQSNKTNLIFLDKNICSNQYEYIILFMNQTESPLNFQLSTSVSFYSFFEDLSIANFSIWIAGNDWDNEIISFDIGTNPTNGIAIIKLLNISKKFTGNESIFFSLQTNEKYSYDQKYRFKNANMSFTLQLKPQFPSSITQTQIEKITNSGGAITQISTISCYTTNIMMAKLPISFNSIGASNLVYLSKFLSLMFPQNLIGYWQGERDSASYLDQVKKKISFPNENLVCANCIDFSGKLFEQKYSIFLWNNTIIFWIMAGIAILGSGILWIFQIICGKNQNKISPLENCNVLDSSNSSKKKNEEFPKKSKNIEKSKNKEKIEEKIKNEPEPHWSYKGLIFLFKFYNGVMLTNFPLVFFAMIVNIKQQCNSIEGNINFVISILYLYQAIRVLYVSFIIALLSSKNIAKTNFVQKSIHVSILSKILPSPTPDEWESSQYFYQNYTENLNLETNIGRYWILITLIRSLFFAIFLEAFKKIPIIGISWLLTTTGCMLVMIIIYPVSESKWQRFQYGFIEACIFILAVSLIVLGIFDLINFSNGDVRNTVGQIILVVNILIFILTPVVLAIDSSIWIYDQIKERCHARKKKSKDKENEKEKIKKNGVEKKNKKKSRKKLHSHHIRGEMI